MLKFYSFIFLFFVFTFSVLSQQETNQGNNSDNVLYRNEESFGVYIHSAGGLGLAYRRGWNVTGYSKKLIEIEASNFKSPKEVKNFNSYFTTGTSGYVYGKLNSILLLRGGVGYQGVLFRKVDRKNVEVRYIAFTGLTLAFAKPAYLYVLDTSNINGKVVEKYDPSIHNQNNIVGKAPFSEGLGHTKLIPGAYLKLGLNFEYSERYDVIRAIEAGIIMDAYPSSLKIMANSINRNPLVSIYLKMIWGRKWY
jgi:hypothetical protein